MAPSNGPGDASSHASQSNNDWRQSAARILDNKLTIAAFGIGLPLVFALGGWAVGVALRPLAAPRRDRFRLASHEALLLEVSLALVLAVWTFLPQRARIPARVFAVVLSVGVALAAAYAAVLWAPTLRAFVRLYSTYDDADPVVFVGAAASIPTLTAAIFYRQAHKAWMLSGARSNPHPHRMVLIIAGGAVAACALTMSLGTYARDLAVKRLSSGRPDAIEHSMRPLRVAAALRGEDRILDDVYWGESDSLLRTHFNEAFRRLTGQTAEDRFGELHRD